MRSDYSYIDPAHSGVGEGSGHLVVQNKIWSCDVEVFSSTVDDTQIGKLADKLVV